MQEELQAASNEVCSLQQEVSDLRLRLDSLLTTNTNLQKQLEGTQVSLCCCACACLPLGCS